MKILSYTLISEGTTDAALIPIIDWIFHECEIPLVQGRRAEFWRYPTRPRNLSDKITIACRDYPCEVLFIHRDADNAHSSDRCREIKAAIQSANPQLSVPAVAVIPVRMLEAWLLISETAIRYAASNPNGTTPLNLPPISKLEGRPDPKADLTSALQNASGFSGRRLKKFDVTSAFWRVVEYMPDFASLRRLTGFSKFEASIQKLKEAQFKPGFYSELGD